MYSQEELDKIKDSVNFSSSKQKCILLGDIYKSMSLFNSGRIKASIAPASLNCSQDFALDKLSKAFKASLFLRLKGSKALLVKCFSKVSTRGIKTIFLYTELNKKDLFSQAILDELNFKKLANLKPKGAVHLASESLKELR